MLALVLDQGVTNFIEMHIDGPFHVRGCGQECTGSSARSSSARFLTRLPLKLPRAGFSSASSARRWPPVSTTWTSHPAPRGLVVPEVLLRHELGTSSVAYHEDLSTRQLTHSAPHLSFSIMRKLDSKVREAKQRPKSLHDLISAVSCHHCCHIPGPRDVLQCLGLNPESSHCATSVYLLVIIINLFWDTVSRSCPSWVWTCYLLTTVLRLQYQSSIKLFDSGHAQTSVWNGLAMLLS